MSPRKSSPSHIRGVRVPLWTDFRSSTNLRACLSLILLSVLTACTSPDSAHISVEWTTASEVNTAGFNLYRSESPDGPFTRVNSELIPASPDPLAGGKYKYEDANITPGRTYYYKLEDIELGGVAMEHGPIQIIAPSTNNGTIAGILIIITLAFIALGLLRARRRTLTQAR